ncbi:MAG: hypothetical protein KKH98_08945 [Spirochaetes bacterium]|nr:hypothetical protein [Spirochaetota bacterium]
MGFKKRIIIPVLIMFVFLLPYLTKGQSGDVSLHIDIISYDVQNAEFSPMSKPAELSLKNYYFSSFSNKGISFIDYSKWGYSTSTAEESLNRMKADYVNYVALNFMVYQDTGTSTVIYRDGTKTPDDRALTNIINDIHSRNMKVFLKVNVDAQNGDSRTAFNPTSKPQWFSSYKTIITQYARLAQQNNVEMFSAGVELKTLSGSSYQANWNDIISSIRNIYTYGDVIYCANWNEYQNVSFWDSLDYIGIDAYFPLNELQDPAVAQISNGWYAYNGTWGAHNWVNEIDTFRQSKVKDVLFTEIGYRSADYAAKEPWSEKTVINLPLQERCYSAAMKVWKPITWLKGLFWWDWPINVQSGGGDNHHFEYDTVNWAYDTYTTDMGCTNVERTTERAYQGFGSLKMDYHLVYDHANYSKGDAYWEIGDQYLRGKRLSVYVYCPAGSMGSASHYNGLTLFAKDADWNYYQGAWNNIYITNQWFKLTWDLPDEAWASHVRQVGLKFSTPGTGSALENNYDGPIYMDDFIWEDIVPPGDNYGFESQPIAWYNAGNACSSVQQSAAVAYSGSYSLQMNYDLKCSDNTGFAEWDMGSSGTNLYGKEVNIWVYCPAGSGGTASAKNGVTIYMKDAGFNWIESEWNNIYGSEDSWMNIRWTVTSNVASNARYIGIKVGTAGSCTSSNEYTGPIYIDDLIWSNASAPPATPEGYYDWEDGTLQGWYPDNYINNRAFYDPPAPINTNERAQAGTQSMKCHFRLIKNNVNYDSGYMWVDCARTNLTGKTVSVYIWAPASLQWKGGIQLAFKDNTWTYCDTDWRNIASVGSWVRYSAALPADINWNDGIDLTKIEHMGIKLGSGGGMSSGQEITGYIYIDEFDCDY